MSEEKVTVTMGFVLPCRLCGVAVDVGTTREFEQNIGGARTAYYAPDARAGARPVGISAGSGDTFACLPCHVIEWDALLRACLNPPKDGAR